MRRRLPPPAFGQDEESSRDLLRFHPAALPPEAVRPHAPQWSPEEFGEWLRRRQRWRETHTGGLPRMRGLERLAMRNMAAAGQLDRDVIRVEETAPRAEPDWFARSRDRRHERRRSDE